MSDFIYSYCSTQKSEILLCEMRANQKIILGERYLDNQKTSRSFTDGPDYGSYGPTSMLRVFIVQPRKYLSFFMTGFGRTKNPHQHANELSRFQLNQKLVSHVWILEGYGSPVT